MVIAFSSSQGPEVPSRRSDVIELFHYTSEEGFRSLTSGKRVDWLPSLGPLPKPVQVRSAPLGSDKFETVNPDELDSAAFRVAVAGSLAAVGLLDPLSQVLAWADPSMPPTGLVNDKTYGPGWYASDLGPKTSTDVLLKEIWSGIPSASPKTEYWLRLRVESDRFTTPDPQRPHIKFLPVINRKGLTGDPPKPFGQSTSAVYLIEAGRRKQTWLGHTKVASMYRPKTPLVLIKPFMHMIEGFSSLDFLAQFNIKQYYGMEP